MDLVASLLGSAQVWGTNFLVLIILTASIIAWTMRGGKSALVSLVASLYMGYALYTVFPYTDTIIALGTDTTTKALFSIGVFIAASIIPYLFIRRVAYGAFGQLHFLTNAILSFLVAGFIMALLYHVFDISNIYSFPNPINQLFAPQGYFFYWFIAPLAGLFFLVR